MSGVDLAVPLVLPPGPGPVDVEGHAFTTLVHAALAGDEWGPEELRTVLGWGGRLAGPVLLSNAFDGLLIDGDALAAHIGPVWSGAEYPDAALGHDRWRELFELAGFTRDGVPAPRPAEPVELWRGAVPARRADWSWTTDQDMAGRYASGYFNRRPGRLYRLVAPPGALLCAYNGRGESEYVVDTDHPGVVITDA
ncbi:hypothetical protein [Streptomyces sp. IB2014 011-1]|uniref:hypothetical protein n=1 Tax=Streptomyces sp. IB2014 011-1 TaxID=1844478 RepID=UPI000978DF8D|nr:hypothetical protein [Streptomyces sp. IB2014 011-1]ONI48515.1 hypothetical protein STIB_73400 [Streptomyces sp. IB2014 011-1]